MTFVLTLATLGLVAAAPVPKGQAKDPWVGKPLFMKSRDVKPKLRAADGTERPTGLNLIFFYSVTKVTADAVEASLPFADKPAVYVFRREDVLPAAAAIDFYTDQLKGDPKDAYTLAFRGWANECEEKRDAADADFSAAVRLDPNNTFFRRYRATVRMAAEKYAGAVEDFDHLLERTPNYEWAQRQRALAKVRLKKFDEAIAEYTALLDATTDRPGTLLARGLAYDRAGRYADALADYAAVREADAKNAAGWNNRAWLRATCPDAKFRDAKEAVAAATRACELTAWGNPGYLDTLAAAHAEAGDFESAVKWEREAMLDRDLMKRDGDAVKARLELYLAKKPYHRKASE